MDNGSLTVDGLQSSDLQILFHHKLCATVKHCNLDLTLQCRGIYRLHKHKINNALPINKQFKYTQPVHQELKIYRKSLVEKQNKLS